MPETVEEISEKPEVREELAVAAGEKREEKVKARGRDKFWFVTHALLLVGCAIIYFLLGSELIPLPQSNVDLARRILRGAILIVVLLAIAKTISVYGLGKIADASTRFTLRRVQRLIVGLLIALIVLSVIFVNWYAALTALGVGSVIVALAVQTPMKSFIGWIYILVRAPYRVGDRIKISDATGDVIDVSYLDTTLWEFGGGDILSTDHPTGRIIKFPDSKVLSTSVDNYCWPVLPYIWNEIKFKLAYESDLEFIAETMQRIAAEEVGERMMKQISVYREILAQTPVD